ncbi:hypothetical protein J4225_00950 [Candidatus Pacearchaeota archaeon]|nr:hypothetical protein [Candidatus Pacearchaeota archaeon]
MSDFLFHQVSEKEKEEIKKEAKQIMNSFYEKLSKIKVKIKEPLIERKESERQEGEGSEGNEEFRDLMFNNAPNKQEGFIIAEKKKW